MKTEYGLSETYAAAQNAGNMKATLTPAIQQTTSGLLCSLSSTLWDINSAVGVLEAVIYQPKPQKDCTENGCVPLDTIDTRVEDMIDRAVALAKRIYAMQEELSDRLGDVKIL